MGKKKILIAEDEPSIVLSLEFLLAGAGYEVVAACDGKEALLLADELRPDLIVLDIMLPVINGFDVCAEVRRRSKLGHTKILILTARGREAEVQRGLALGADAFMTKPFATREFIRTVNELLAPL
jgi:two-component system alkaline phosphatase synthesis response regulator PhoP